MNHVDALGNEVAIGDLCAFQSQYRRYTLGIIVELTFYKANLSHVPHKAYLHYVTDDGDVRTSVRHNADFIRVEQSMLGNYQNKDEIKLLSGMVST